MSDFLQTLEYAGFTARIKRLSENLMHDARTIYKESGMDIEPNWHLVFLLLKDRGELSVTEIAEALGFSHPALIKITQKMSEKGYLESIAHPSDSRKRLLRLSDKSEQLLPELERKWALIASVVQEYVDEGFLAKLEQLEAALGKKKMATSFKECISRCVQ